MIADAALQSICAFALVFVFATFVQHVLMVFLYRGLFVRLKDIKYIGSVLSVPTVFLHEVVGHIIPALLSGSNVIGVDLREEKGNVSVKYEKNIFGGVSVFVAGFGPTFILPLLFIVLYALASGQDIIEFISEPDIIGKYVAVLRDVCALDNARDVLLVLASLIIAPGAASSSGDMRSVISFVRESPLIVLVMCAVALFVLYASYTGGFYLSDYGYLIALNTLLAFVVMYIIALLSLYFIIEGSKRNRYFVAALVLALGIFGSKYLMISNITNVLPVLSVAFAFPLITGLVLANLVLILLRLKK
ncbi:MAG: hypothetical protein QW500_01235 [Candidatus Micrarchaeia archaeon]